MKPNGYEVRHLNFDKLLCLIAMLIVRDSQSKIKQIFLGCWKGIFLSSQAYLARNKFCPTSVAYNKVRSSPMHMQCEPKSFLSYVSSVLLLSQCFSLQVLFFFSELVKLKVLYYASKWWLKTSFCTSCVSSKASIFYECVSTVIST